jgi:hypothetical protein
VKIVPNKIAHRFFLEIFGYKTFVKIYLILPEILSVINSWESGFSRILKSDGGLLGARDISGAIENVERTDCAEHIWPTYTEQVPIFRRNPWPQWFDTVGILVYPFQLGLPSKCFKMFKNEKTDCPFRILLIQNYLG